MEGMVVVRATNLRYDHHIVAPLRGLPYALAETAFSTQGNGSPHGGSMRINQPMKFPFGQLVATATALDKISLEDMRVALVRHGRGDWGEVCAEDRKANDSALIEGTRLLSSYRSSDGPTFWIITEWDGSATTLLFPDEY